MLQTCDEHLYEHDREPCYEPRDGYELQICQCRYNKDEYHKTELGEKEHLCIRVRGPQDPFYAPGKRLHVQDSEQPADEYAEGEVLPGKEG